jgi:hypothetical protein
MFNRIKAAFLWGRMISLIRQEKYAEASAAADEFRRIEFSDAAFTALDATIDVLNFRSELAREKFVKAADMATDTNENERYVSLYCKYYIFVIDNQEDCETLRQQALSLHPSGRVKAALPLPLNNVLVEE